MRRLTFFVVLLFSLPAFSQARHPFTFEDMMKLKRVGEPVPSPDGQWVLFSAVDVDLAANNKTPHIWIVPLNSAPTKRGSPPVPGAEGALRTHPHPRSGRRPSTLGSRWQALCLPLDKEGGSQIWIADFDGAAGAVTDVHMLTSIATEAGGELWSPDGKNILFTSDVYPECADQACNAQQSEGSGKLESQSNHL